MRKKIPNFPIHLVVEQTQSVISNSAQNQSQLQGLAAADSSMQIPQDVTASVNTDQQQVQNPFVVNAPAIPTQEGPLGIRYAFGEEKLVRKSK